MPHIVIDKNRCKSCYICLNTCPKGLIKKSSETSRLGDYLVEFEDKNNEGPELKNEVMDINVQKLFDLFLDRMSDIEKFFALIEIGCSEKYASMTVSQFSVDPVFINIVEADSRYAKNIKMGDVVIKRPDRHSYTDRDIELKDVKFVGGTVVRYQREQTRFRWAKLKEVISEDDILGNKSVEYFQEKWDELLNKYNY